MNALMAEPGNVEGMSDDDLFALVPYDGTDLEKYEKETNPRYTAERLRANEPIRYETIRRSLLEGQTIGVIRRTNKCGNGVIYAILDRMEGGREAYRARCAGKMKDVAHLCADLLLEKLHEEKDVMKIGVVMGIATDKTLALSGQPGLVVEVRHTIDATAEEAFNAKLARAREELAQRKVTGRVVEPGCEMRDAGCEPPLSLASPPDDSAIPDHESRTPHPDA